MRERAGGPADSGLRRKTALRRVAAAGALRGRPVGQAGGIGASATCHLLDGFGRGARGSDPEVRGGGRERNRVFLREITQ